MSAHGREGLIPDLQFHLLADALPELVSYIDSHRRYQFNNKAYESWFGVSRQKLKGRTVSEVIGPAAYKVVKPYIDKVLSGRRATFEGPIPYKTGPARYVSIDYVPVWHGNKRVTGFYVLITDLSKHREAAILAERNRLAREVHDTIAQDLAGIVLQLENAEEAFTRQTGEALDHIVRSRQRARSTLAGIRHSLLALSASQIETKDLTGSIRDLIERLRSETSIPFTFSVKGTPRRLDAAIEENLFRIAQQALTNAIQHSGAEVVRVSLDFRGRTVHLRVADNGRGFVISASRRGLGLRSMRERAHKLGGKLRVASQPGKGTWIETRIPFLQSQGLGTSS